MLGGAEVQARQSGLRYTQAMIEARPKKEANCLSVKTKIGPEMNEKSYRIAIFKDSDEPFWVSLKCFDKAGAEEARLKNEKLISREGWNHRVEIVSLTKYNPTLQPRSKKL